MRDAGSCGHCKRSLLMLLRCFCERQSCHFSFRGSAQGKLIAKPPHQPLLCSFGAPAPQNHESLALIGGFVLQTSANLSRTAFHEQPTLVSYIFEYISIRRLRERLADRGMMRWSMSLEPTIEPQKQKPERSFELRSVASRLPRPARHGEIARIFREGSLFAAWGLGGLWRSGTSEASKIKARPFELLVGAMLLLSDTNSRDSMAETTCGARAPAT